jgi:hypothetical protein
LLMQKNSYLRRGLSVGNWQSYRDQLLVEADERNGKFLPLVRRSGLEPLRLVLLWPFRDSDQAPSHCNDCSLLQFGFVAR